MRFAFFALLLFVTGCSSMATNGPPPDAYLSHNPQQPLFATDELAMADTEIARILETKIGLPETFRVGVIYLDHEREKDGKVYRINRRAELPQIHAAFAGLQENERVYDVSYVPQLLIPRDFSAGAMRAAAARYQADWILIFQTRTTILTKKPFLGAKRTRAYCAAECMVLDVRTGLVAFSSQAQVALTDEMAADDWSLDETSGLVEQQAIEEAMAQNIDNLDQFIAAGRS